MDGAERKAGGVRRQHSRAAYEHAAPGVHEASRRWTGGGPWDPRLMGATPAPGGRLLGLRLGCSRKRPGRYVGICKLQRPFDGLEVHLVDIRVVPRFGVVCERGVEYATFAVHLCPGQREIPVGDVDILVDGQLGCVQPQQDPTLLAGKVLGLIKLIVEFESEREGSGGGETRVLVDDICRDRAPRGCQTCRRASRRTPAMRGTRWWQCVPPRNLCRRRERMTGGRPSDRVQARPPGAPERKSRRPY